MTFQNFPLGLDEALVLFEFIETVNEEKLREIATPSEVLALRRMAGSIERTLVEVFAPEYKELLRVAREQLDRQAGE